MGFRTALNGDMSAFRAQTHHLVLESDMGNAKANNRIWIILVFIDRPVLASKLRFPNNTGTHVVLQHKALFYLAGSQLGASWACRADKNGNGQYRLFLTEDLCDRISNF